MCARYNDLAADRPKMLCELIMLKIFTPRKSRASGHRPGERILWRGPV